MLQRSMLAAMAVLLALFSSTASARDKGVQPPGPPPAVGPVEYPLNEIKGGVAENVSLTFHPANKYQFFIRGQNKTTQVIKDFEIELKNCGKAKIEAIKVFHPAEFGEEDELKKAGQKFDWDVDDDLSGLSDQDFTNDAGAPDGKSNETDNYDDSPGTRARVDANGRGHNEDRTEREDTTPLSPAEKAGLEDGGEEAKAADPPKNPMDPSQTPLDGNGGIDPGKDFLIGFETTAEWGFDCTISLTPSGVGGVKIAMSEPAPGLAPGQEYAAAVPGAVAPAAIGSGVEFAFTPGGSFASIGTEQTTNFSGTTHGKDIDYAAANLHGDLRYYWGGLGEGHTGWFRPALIVGLKGAGTLGGAERGLEEDNHPPAGIESFVDYEIDGTLTPFLGFTFADFDCSRINFLIGPRITFAEINGITDESGGGGVQERFSRNVVQVGPAFGLELDVPIRPLSHEGFEVGVRVAGWGEYLPGTHVNGESSTFPFDYRFETDGAMVGTVRGGFFLRWGL